MSSRPLEIVAAADGAPAPAPFWPANTRRLSIGVLVDLERGLRAGGHVKCWERLAEAAARSHDLLDLTVYMEGREDSVDHLAPHSRIVCLRPVFSTRTLPFLANIPDHTDLAPLHPRLLRRLLRHDVVHTTDAYFAFTRTAVLAARLGRVRLVNSVHTATADYTRIYAETVMRRWGVFGDILVDRLRLPERLGRGKERQLARHVARCHASLDAAGSGKGLRRGIDTVRFAPAKRDRRRLAAELGVGPDRVILIFAGRVEDGKNVMTLARAVRILLDRGLPVHAILAGDGRRRDSVADILGPHATLPGAVDQDSLAWLYASSDIFVFPSAIEVSPNVVLEAKASGLAVVVASSGGGRYVRESGTDGVLVAEREPTAWADAIGALVDAPARRAAMGRAARADIERFYPSWDTVLAEDLLPVWRAAVP